MSPDEPLIFPVGHYIGAYHPDDGAALAHHTVRIGREPVRLRDDDELTLWGLAHGGDDPDRPWTRPQLLDLAEQAGIADAARLLDELIDEDIIVEVRPGTADAVDFAQSHRLMPLLFGLGSDSPATHRIGFGAQTAIEVDRFGYEVWRLCRLTDDLWTFCELYGEALRRAAGSPAGETAPEVLLPRALRAVQALLGRYAGYLDLSPALWSRPR